MYPHFTYPFEYGLVELLSDGNRGGKRITKSNICHRKDVVATMSYAILGLATPKKIVVPCEIKQGSVLADGNLYSEIFVTVPFGM